VEAEGGMTALEEIIDSRPAGFVDALSLALSELPDDQGIELAIAAADRAIAIAPEIFPDEVSIESTEDEEWPDEPVQLSFDIFNKKAQGVLNRAMQAAKKLSASARQQLSAALGTPTPQMKVQ